MRGSVDCLFRRVHRLCAAHIHGRYRYHRRSLETSANRVKSQIKTTARDATRCLGYIFRYAVLCCAVLHATYMLYTLHVSSLPTASLLLKTSIRHRLIGRPIGANVNARKWVI
jgi:hypothetical protein